MCINKSASLARGAAAPFKIKSTEIKGTTATDTAAAQNFFIAPTKPRQKLCCNEDDNEYSPFRPWTRGDNFWLALKMALWLPVICRQRGTN